MAIALSDVQQGVRDRYENLTLGGAALNRFVASAVRYYEKFNPDEKSSTITTVVDKQDYDLPSDFLVMRDVEYYPSGQIFGQLYAGSPASEYELMIRRPARYHHVSDRVIESIDRQALAESTKGRWEVVGDKIRLWPTPSSVATYDYYYGASYSLNVGGDGYDDIPTRDLDIMVDLTVAELLLRSLTSVSEEFDYSEGLQRVIKHYAPGNIMMTIRILRSTVGSRYAPILGAVS
jgi:hypothetical protein